MVIVLRIDWLADRGAAAVLLCGGLQVLDFGCAQLNYTGQMAAAGGALNYMSPEVSSLSLPEGGWGVG